jgi:tRNA nucleotidyltransferase (CCA-adding enzyme)
LKVDGQELLARLSGRAVDLLDACGRIAEERGEDAYLVGGSVRDLILGRGETDLDVVVEGDGMAIAQALARSVGGALTRHHVFQTARVDTKDGMRVDVATARSEDYPRPGHLPRVVAGSLQEDLQRRDFTINTMAIALDPGCHGVLIDPEGGVADLQAGIVRVLHSRSFADDPTRILRALRFVDRFGYRLDEQTGEQLSDAVAGGYLEYVSGARVRRELSYMFSESPITGPRVLQKHGVLPAIHEGLAADGGALEALAENRAWYGDVVSKRGMTRGEGSLEDPEFEGERGVGGQAENHAVVNPGWTLVLTSCAADLAGQERWKLASHLGLSRPEREPLVESGMPWERARQEWRERLGEGGRAAMVADAIFSRLCVGTLLVQLSSSGIAEDEKMEAALRVFLRETQWVSPCLKGGDLIEMGVRRGPAVGQAIDLLRQARVEGSVVDEEGERQMIIAWLAGHRHDPS